MQRGGSVYIMTNVHNEVLYFGVTSDLVKRIQQHKNKTFGASFSAKAGESRLLRRSSAALVKPNGYS
jgi:putative endonuclease